MHLKRDAFARTSFSALFQVTIAPFDAVKGVTGRPKNYTVPYPGSSIRFEDLRPDTIYNITVQAGTDSGYGQILWGTYSTLAPGQNHILRLVYRTPTTLTVEWEPVWATDRGYIVSASKSKRTTGTTETFLTAAAVIL